MAFMSQYATALAKNLAAISPGDLDMVFLGSTGSEAMEAAHQGRRAGAGAGAVEDPLRGELLPRQDQGRAVGHRRPALPVASSSWSTTAVKVPFGDIEAIERAFEADPEIGIVVLETIQGGGGIVEAPPGFWRELRALCDQHGVLWVADEVQCGYGRTGRFFAFEHDGVVPDVTALAKSLGGGKAAIGAMIARRDVYMKAYGTPKTAMIHARRPSAAWARPASPRSRRSTSSMTRT